MKFKHDPPRLKLSSALFCLSYLNQRRSKYEIQKSVINEGEEEFVFFLKKTHKLGKVHEVDVAITMHKNG
jgi:hypothetical protein